MQEGWLVLQPLPHKMLNLRHLRNMLLQFFRLTNKLTSYIISLLDYTNQYMIFT